MPDRGYLTISPPVRNPDIVLLTPEVLARMKAIAIGDTTLFDLHAQYQEAAKQLGAVDEKRARLNRPSVTPTAQVLAARREWIRWANILLTTAENAGVSPATDALLFAPLREAAKKADSRWDSNGAPAPEPAPTPVPDVMSAKGHGRPTGWAAASRFQGR